MPDVNPPPDDHRTGDTGSHPDHDDDAPLPTANRRTLWLGVAAIGVVLLVVLVIGTASRVVARQDLQAATRANAASTVTVVHPQAVKGATLVLPAQLVGWSQAPVYARTNGYLRAWYTDIGAHVHKGQVMAAIETPEVDQQLAASRAALATAQAQLDLAATTAARWNKLLAQNAVSKQDADDRRGDYAAKLAMRNQAQADVNRLKALTGFQQIIAPFDGVVTARQTDIGSLIVAGPGGSQPLFTVSDLSRLRIYVNVPQSYLAAIKQGLSAQFTVPEMAGRKFSAKIGRTAGAIDPQSGSMQAELDYDNSEGLLKPGGYADLTFDLPSPTGTDGLLRIPADALLFRADGTTVAVAGPDGKVSIHKIAIVTDLGTELQISSDLSENDQVIDSPNDGIEPGDQVHVQPPNAKPHA
jgi:RND family efflux transporter MFP subunit